MSQAVKTSGERRLVLQKDLTELRRLAAFARDAGRAQGLDDAQIFALELCLEEAAANIIKHSRAPGRPGSNISVSISRAARCLVARLEDDGAPFDPTRVPVSPVAESLENARVGGLGIHLIRRLATSMRYERAKDCNRLTLEFGFESDKT